MARITSHNAPTTGTTPTQITCAFFARDRYSIENHPIDGELLQESGEGRIISLPDAREAIVRLAQVHDGKVTPCAFAAEYGLLGDTALKVATHQWPRDDQGAVIQPKTHGGADRLTWFTQHAADVFRILHLLEAIGANDSKTIRAAFVTIGALKDPQLAGDVTAIVGAANEIELAQQEIVRLLKPRLQGINRELTVTAGGFRSTFKARALVDLIFWTLADLAQDVTAGAAFVRHCKRCGALFITDDQRKLFCSKKCGNLFGMHTWRKRQKESKKSNRRKP